MSEDKPVEEPVEVTEEPCEEVILPKKRMTTNACQPNNMGNEQNAVVQPLLTGLFFINLHFSRQITKCSSRFQPFNKFSWNARIISYKQYGK